MASSHDLAVYVSCAGTGDIVQFALDRASGGMTPRSRAPVPKGSPATSAAPGSAFLPSYSIPMALHPSGRVLYAALRTEPFTLLSYRIDAATGALTLLGKTAVPASTPHIRTDRSGRLLFGAAYQGDCVWVSAIGEDGGVAGPPHQVVSGISNPHFVLPDRENRFVYVAAASGDVLLQLRLDLPGGRLEPVEVPPVRLPQGTRPRHLALHPGGTLLYCITEAQALIEAYRIDAATGVLAPAPELGAGLPRDPAAPHMVGADLHITPDGRMLYASERTGSTIGGFAVDAASGALSLVDARPVDPIPRSFAIDPAGRFLVSAGQDNGRIAIHAIDGASGRLTLLDSYDAGAGAAWVEIVDLAHHPSASQ